MYFQGLYCSDSEGDDKTLELPVFTSAVCMHCNLWGAENFEGITIRHSKFAAQRFAHEAAPALTSFSNSSSALIVAGIKAARGRIVARTDEDRESFSRKDGLSKLETVRILKPCLAKKIEGPKASLISCKASPRWPGPSSISVRGWNWKARQRT